MVDNFPLSLLILNVSYSLSTDDLALVTVLTLSPKPYFTEVTTVFYIKNNFFPHFPPNFTLSPSFLSEFSTQTPKQDCNFLTLH